MDDSSLWMYHNKFAVLHLGSEPVQAALRYWFLKILATFGLFLETVQLRRVGAHSEQLEVLVARGNRR